MYTVKTLKDQLEELITQGFGDRVVAFPILDDDIGYAGDFVLVREVDTRDQLEVAVYLGCYKPEKDSELWEEIEAKAEKS
jgi:hypothetical protein